MSQRDQRHEQLKSLLDQWNVALNEYDELREDDGHSLKELKRTLENAWTVFDRRFK